MNNYVLEYYQGICDGSIVVGTHIRRWYEKLVKGLGKQYTFNQKKANAAIVFIENFCRHHEGELAPQKIKLELWEKALISVIFGFVDETGKRQFREVFVVVARKNGKTLLAAAIANYMAFLDGEYGARVYFAAPKLEQANLCFDAFYQMITKEPKLNELAKKRRTDIYIADTNSSAKPLAFNAKKSDGLNCSLCIADECASWVGDAGLKFYEVIKSSMGARKQPMLLSISTAGYINDGIYDEMMKRATSLLNDSSAETRLAPFLYIIDDTDKWNDINELRKSNPNLGISVSVDYMLEEIAVAEGSLSKKAEFLTKYANVKQNSSQAWINEIDIAKGFNEELKLDDFRGCYCVGGIDLSRTTDLTSCCIIIERGGKLYVFTQFFMPGERVEEMTQRDGVPYGIYIKNGWLRTSGDNFVDYHDCYKWFTDLIETYQIYPLKVGYDRYSAQYLVQDLTQYGFNMDDVYQGYNLTSVINQTDGEIKDGRFEFGNNQLMKSHLLNSALKIDNEQEKKKLIKAGQYLHIDGTAALLDAMCMREKYWDEIGEQLKNEGK